MDVNSKNTTKLAERVIDCPTSEDAKQIKIKQKGAIDLNDYLYAKERAEDEIIEAEACPIVKGKIHPHVTRFKLKNGKTMDIFHIKPVYYQDIEGTFRPLGDITHGFGNTWIHFKENWQSKIHPRYSQWLSKRLSHFNKPKVAIGDKFVGAVDKENNWGISVEQI